MAVEEIALSSVAGTGVDLAEAQASAWPPARPVYEAAKRALDILLSILVLALLSPFMLAIALAIRLTSPGPAFYRGEVVGRGGRRFTWYKFRTMIEADDQAHRDWLRDFVMHDKPYVGGVYKLTPDPRVTVVGQFLRRFSLDELPQFYNVLRSDMSIVGPRPPITYEYDLYGPTQLRRLAVRPGITGLHQVTERSAAAFSRMLATDLDYIRRRSIGLDLAIMARTVGVMISGRGAA